MNVLENGQLWQRYCDRLSQAAATLKRPAAPTNAFDQAEGTRYLSRLIRLGLEIYLESGDPEFPTFYQPSHETAKIGGDNPDNLYLSATISGKHCYRLTGNIGTVAYLSIGSKANRYAIDGTMPSTGELTRAQFRPDAGGDFTIIASVIPPVEDVAWLPLAEDSSMLHLRQTFLQRCNETPATIAIERISPGPSMPASVDPGVLENRLMAAADFVVGSSALFADWAEKFMSRPNQLRDWGQDMFIKAGGDPQIFYVHGYWALQPKQALVIKTAVPECEHWNIQVNNWWMESLDYRYHPVCINKHSARLNDDGSVTVVIAQRDPGFGNWLPTVGHAQGFVLLRWVKADCHPVPGCRVIELPTETE
ncbi:MAG: DUF1214 domain-containing protein [Gammaproteobacteria bacterium]|uniref:DUF1214 domain-containing protein n=1 Tax=Pseudomaricurvus alcaniphilus TaxID=1166482 RepID=UPI001409ACB4|nr:DUF1214 domain-containing protein [Pseudomaricurvus alcaniphilus]MBR9910631.1 DUF1214 domain-containing protein [Gammaproteobacteria bacterium]NHN36845.1 DUF1214 domain-containing protein [Pseudomaricurvus alcaniphilus]